MIFPKYPYPMTFGGLGAEPPVKIFPRREAPRRVKNPFFEEKGPVTPLRGVTQDTSTPFAKHPSRHLASPDLAPKALKSITIGTYGAYGPPYGPQSGPTSHEVRALRAP